MICDHEAPNYMKLDLGAGMFVGGIFGRKIELARAKSRALNSTELCIDHCSF